MNVLVLMAGDNKGLEEAGYIYPKNLIEIDGLPLIQRVIQQLGALRENGAKFTFFIRSDEDKKFHTGSVIRLLDPEAVCIKVPESTAGALCTALLAQGHIDNDEPLVIVNGDQIIDVDYKHVLTQFKNQQLGGGIIVFESVHPRWSYVKTDENKLVIEAAEKRPISKLATAGFYYFEKGKSFVQAAHDMLRKDARVDGLFYICPVYNELILRQRKIGVFEITRDAYHSLKTPSGIQEYEERERGRGSR
jgi:dTDP-glucose pyrophosphorylase